jgi:hypothetical protein
MPEPGDLVPYFNRKTGRQEWKILMPERCRNGHALVAGVIHLSWRGCLCRPGGIGGHTLVICCTCDDRQLVPPCLEMGA